MFELKIMNIVLELQQAHKYACQPYYGMHTLCITVYGWIKINHRLDTKSVK